MITSKLPETLKEIDLSIDCNEEPSPECQLDPLDRLISAAETHIEFSKLYLRMLRGMSEPYGSETNTNPWKTVKEGSYYLGNAYSLVELYKKYIPGSIKNDCIQSVNNILVALEFDRNHISAGYTDEAYGGKANCFVSEGQGTKYYNLLHSDLKQDVRSFIAMVEEEIDLPVKWFIKSMKQKKLQKSALSAKLIEAIENDNSLEVENCVGQGLNVNIKDSDGAIPLHYAVNNGNINIVRMLLKHGADVSQTINTSETSLHIACFKGHKEVVEDLIQHVNRDKLYAFIDAKTTSAGTASLHLAAKNGFVEIVKSLLNHGATYDIENRNGRTPFDLSTDENVSNLLALVAELFEDARIGNVQVNSKLKATQSEEFLAVTSARNKNGHTILQVAIANNHKDIATSTLAEMLK